MPDLSTEQFGLERRSQYQTIRPVASRVSAIRGFDIHMKCTQATSYRGAGPQDSWRRIVQVPVDQLNGWVDSCPQLVVSCVQL